MFAVGKDGTGRAAGQKIYLGPALLAVSPLTLDPGKYPLDKLALTGNRLGKIKKICLKGRAGCDYEGCKRRFSQDR